MQLNLLKWAIFCKGHCNLQNGLCCPGSHWRQSQRGGVGAGRDEDKDRLVCPPAPAQTRLSFLLSPSSDEHYTQNHGSSELRRAAEITQAPYFTDEKTEGQRGDITCPGCTASQAQIWDLNLLIPILMSFCMLTSKTQQDSP